MTRAARIIEFLERYVLVPDGAQVGQPMAWQSFKSSSFGTCTTTPTARAAPS